MSRAYWLNTAWMLLCRREGRAFRAARGDVAGVQARLLKRILSSNAQSAWGLRHGFEGIRDPAAYQRRVPVSDYAALSPSIDRIAAGHVRELSGAPVTRFERTSGSTGGEKLIPYTASLHRQFQRAISAWISDLLRNRPALRAGRAFWSVSPALQTTDRVGAVPVGLDDDTAYLSRLQRAMARHVLAVPPTLARVHPLEAFRYATLLHLLAAADLALISVWSPTFLTALLAGLDEWGELLIYDIRNGSVSWPTAPEAQRWGPRVPASPRRADELAAALRSTGSRADQLARIWPRLGLISCWADASAAAYVPPLRAQFPGVEIQPKGLLATEGVVSIPLLGQPGGALAIRSHFFEFQETGADARPRLAHELVSGGRYRVLLTTGGGLYRYQLRDEVEVLGLVDGCPHVRLLGRTDATSDLVGEKLHDDHVRAAVARVLERHGLRPAFHLLAPVSGTPPSYRLFLQLEPDSMDASPTHLAQTLDEALRGNPHYGYAVDLGQLGPADVRILPARERGAWEVYESRRLEQGCRAGDIKPVSLDPWTGWEERFAHWSRCASTSPRWTSSASVSTRS